MSTASLSIVQQSPDWTGAVRAFNERLAEKAPGTPFTLSETAYPEWLPAGLHDELFQERYLVVSGTEVRGGYTIKYQQFAVNGVDTRVGFYHNPVTEGSIDPKYSSVGAIMLRDALRRSTVLYCLGMGGVANPLPVMLGAAGWRLGLVPFYFRMLRPSRVLDQLPSLQGTNARKLAAKFAARTALVPLSISGVHWAASRRLDARLSVIEMSQFPDTCDELDARLRNQHSIAARRVKSVLDVLYPPTNSKFIRLFSYDGERLAGWSVCMVTPMKDSRHFGNLTVATLVDCLAEEGAAHPLARASIAAAASRGADLFISNQTSALWGSALKRAGCLEGPSNFALAVSKGVSALIDVKKSGWLADCHFTRGDGDGPINL